MYIHILAFVHLFVGYTGNESSKEHSLMDQAMDIIRKEIERSYLVFIEKSILYLGSIYYCRFFVTRII